MKELSASSRKGRRLQCWNGLFSLCSLLFHGLCQMNLLAAISTNQEWPAQLLPVQTASEFRAEFPHGFGCMDLPYCKPPRMFFYVGSGIIPKEASGLEDLRKKILTGQRRDSYIEQCLNAHVLSLGSRCRPQIMQYGGIEITLQAQRLRDLLSKTRGPV